MGFVYLLRMNLDFFLIPIWFRGEFKHYHCLVPPHLSLIIFIFLSFRSFSQEPNGSLPIFLGNAYISEQVLYMILGSFLCGS